jgi:WD40 repeat protein
MKPLKKIVSKIIIFFLLSSLFISGCSVSRKTNIETDPIKYPRGSFLALGFGMVKDIDFSPDGHLLAVTSSSGVRIYNDTGENILYKLEEVFNVEKAAFCPHQAVIFVSLVDGKLGYWKYLENSELIMIESNETSYVEIMFTSEPGQMLTWSPEDLAVSLWDIRDIEQPTAVDLMVSTMKPEIIQEKDEIFILNNNKLIKFGISTRELSAETELSVGSNIEVFALSPDKSNLAVSSRWGLSLLDLENGTELKKLEETRDCWIKSMAFSKNSEYFTAVCEGFGGGLSAQLYVWSMEDGQLIRHLEDPAELAATKVIFSPDNEKIVSSTWNRVLIWDNQQGKLVNVIEGYGTGEGFALAPDNQTLAIKTGAGEIHLWDLQSQELIKTIADPSNKPSGQPANPIVYSKSGRYLFTGSESGRVFIWDVQKGAFIAQAPVEELGWIAAIAPFSNERKIVFGTWQGGVYQWNVPENDIFTIKEPECGDVIQNIAISPDETLISVRNIHGEISLWDVSDKEHIVSWRGSEGSEINNVFGFNQTGQKIFSGGNGYFQTFNLKGKLLSDFALPYYNEMSIIERGDMSVAIWQSPEIIRVLQNENELQKIEWKMPSKEISSFLYSDDEKYLGICTSDGLVFFEFLVPALNESAS